MKNPLWKRPEEWIIYGHPTPRPAQPRKIDETICRLLTDARKRVATAATRRPA